MNRYICVRVFGALCLGGATLVGTSSTVLSSRLCSGTASKYESNATAAGFCATDQPERPGETVSVRALWDRYCDPFTRSYRGAVVVTSEVTREDGTVEEVQSIVEDAVAFIPTWDHPPENASEIQRRGEFAFMVAQGWDPTSVVRHYQVHCTGFEVNYLSGYEPGWIDDGDTGDVHFTVVDPVPVETIRDRALAKIQPPPPAIGSAPPTGRTVVNLPTWLWVDTPWVELTDWDAQGAVRVDVYARPVDVTWTFDDDEVASSEGEGSVVCDDPGEVWTPDDGDSDSSCQYQFTYPSSWNADGVFHGSVTVRWEVSWSMNGDDQGVFGDISRTTDFDVDVVEIQTVGVFSG